LHSLKPALELVWYVLTKRGVRLGGLALSKEREDLIMSLRAAGKSINAISYETKHRTSAITRVLRERGDMTGRLASRGGKAGKKS